MPTMTTEHERGFEAGYSAAIHDARVNGSRAHAELSAFQGWNNHPTWAVNLWLSNDEPLYRETLDLVETVRDDPGTYDNVEAGIWTRDEALRFMLADRLRHWVRDDLAPDLGATFASDLLGYALDQVDWEEIAQAWIERD